MKPRIAGGGKSLIDMVEISLDVILMDIPINALHLLIDIWHKPFLTVNCSWNKMIKDCTFIA